MLILSLGGGGCFVVNHSKALCWYLVYDGTGFPGVDFTWGICCWVGMERSSRSFSCISGSTQSAAAAAAAADDGDKRHHVMNS